LYLTGTVPMGAGLSSSAALTTSVGRALLASVGQGQDPGALAQRAQRVEHVYAGVQCGLMDPLVIGLGRAGHALQIDFRALTSTPVTLPLDQATVVVVNSGVERRLAGSAYNERRATCEAVVAHLAATGMRGPSGAVLASLRDVTEAHLEAHRADLGEARFRRARHVVRENERVEAAAEALQNGRLGEVGRWMTASHKSLRDDYAVSGPELDLLVELALDHGAWGARLTGAGFGGCTVQLVPPDAVDAFAEDVAAAYQQATGRRAQVLAIRTNHETQTWRVALGA
ncbi:MAG: galactokinase, partial [Bacteroidota bacterium]